jgi:hypothetical protein
LAWLGDAGILVFAVALVVLGAQRQEIDCEWSERVATCRVTTVGALEMRRTRTLEGIHALAHRSGTHLTFVTDARNKDETASFGMRYVDVWDESAADSVAAFLAQRGPRLVLSHGPAHPGVWTAVVMLALLVYAWITRPLGFLVTVDRVKKSLFVHHRGPLFASRTECYPLAAVRSFEMETDAERHRVLLELEGKSLPLTHGFFEGEHHRDQHDDLGCSDDALRVRQQSDREN